MIITSISKFKKILESTSLSTDRANKAKLDLLIQTAKEMIEAYDKADAFELAKKTQNEEIKDLLNKLGTHSIIAKGTLIEVIGAYDNNRMSMKDYEQFLSDCIDTIDPMYMQMHNKIKDIATHLKDDVEYLNFNKNPKNAPTGTIIEGNFSLSNMVNTFKGWLTSLKDWVNSFTENSNNKLEEIKRKAQSFNFQYESVNLNENSIKSKYKKMIINTLASNSNVSFNDLLNNNNINSNSEKTGLYRNIVRLINSNIISREKIGREYIYTLLDTSVVDTELIDEPQDPTTPAFDTALIAETLDKASELIETATQEKYYKELAKLKEKQVIDLLKEFNAKKIAIDDKILSLITRVGKPTLVDSEYMDKMTNADIVTEAVADMATNLFSLYTKTFQTAGSVRQYKDDTNLPEGTLGASFDWVAKTVLAPDTSENVVMDLIRKAARKIKQFISSFKFSSRKVDLALNNI